MSKPLSPHFLAYSVRSRHIYFLSAPLLEYTLFCLGAFACAFGAACNTPISAWLTPTTSRQAVLSLLASLTARFQTCYTL